jgi:hypothetical protein
MTSRVNSLIGDDFRSGRNLPTSREGTIFLK